MLFKKCLIYNTLYIFQTYFILLDCIRKDTNINKSLIDTGLNISNTHNSSTRKIYLDYTMLINTRHKMFVSPKCAYLITELDAKLFGFTL